MTEITESDVHCAALLTESRESVVLRDIMPVQGRPGGQAGFMAPPPPLALRLPERMGVVRVGVLAGLPAFAQKHGASLQDLCERAGETAALLQDPDALFTYQRFGRVLQAARIEAGISHVGLLLGHATTLSSLGLLGLLLKYTDSVGSALALLQQHIRLHDRLGVISVEVEGEHACVHYAVNPPDTPMRADVIDHAIASLHRILQEVCGERWEAEEILLSRGRPLDPTPYRRVFKGKVRFNAETSGIVFPARWLDEQNPLSEPALLRILHERARSLGKDDAVLFSDLVKRAIRPLLSSQKCTALAAADTFRIGKRTLNRRLSEEGTDFRTLIDEVRFDVARHLLGSTEIPLSDIALSLGYAEASTFTRAFRRWSGRSPREWRIATRSSPGPSWSRHKSARPCEPLARSASLR